MPLLWRWWPVKSWGSRPGHSWSISSSPSTGTLFPNIDPHKHLRVSGASYSKALSRHHDCSYTHWETLLWTLVLLPSRSVEMLCVRIESVRSGAGLGLSCALWIWESETGLDLGGSGETELTHRNSEQTGLGLKTFADIFSFPKMVLKTSQTL